MRLIDVVNSESQRVTYEHKELVLEMIVRLYKIPGFISQLFLNFDCDMYSQDVFEDLCKMLAQNALPLSGLYSTHLLSLDALLTIINAIESQCREQTKNVTNGETKSTVTLEYEESKQSDGPSGHKLDDSDYSGTSHEELMSLKHKKKIVNTATAQFNTKPTKGVAYMQEMGLFKTPMVPEEAGKFMRENPHLDKKQIGEYVSNRKNQEVLKAFVCSFEFVGLRVDESLRLFLESFRLPGEAPLITLILERFAEHWQECNGNQLADADAAFTLAYAVIMLNVDQHNKNATKTSDPMTPEQFMRNLRGTNGGGNHDQEMLAEIYTAIRNEEIIMPAEQTGIVKENYVWKCALKRSRERDGLGGYLLSSSVIFEHDLFELIWGPTVAALSQVFDKTKTEEASLTTGTDMIEKSLYGFQRCAFIASHYRMTNVFDHIIISLSKFTTLQNANMYHNSGMSIFSAQFGSDTKAMLATRMVFSLVQKYGDILRNGWKNVLECLLQLFHCQLLPKNMLEAEDYLEPTGRILLYREQEKDDIKVQSSFLDSFVSWMTTNDSVNSSGQRMKTPEEEESCEVATKCVRDCNVELLITESKFLFHESLSNLIDFLIEGSTEDPDSQNQTSPNESLAAPTLNETSQGTLLENAAIFFEELMVRITIQNRDRVTSIWKKVSEHILGLIFEGTKSTAAKKASINKKFVLERSVTAMLRLSVRLGRREDLASMVVRSLKSLVQLKTTNMFQVSRHVSFGLHELLRNNAANIHEAEDWAIIFELIEIAGAGARPESKNKEMSNQDESVQVEPGPQPQQPIQQQGVPGDEDSGHGASSDSESPTTSRTNSPTNTVGSSASGGGHPREVMTRERSGSLGSSTGGWIVLGGTSASAAEQQYQAITEGILVKFDKFSIVHSRKIVMHDSLAFLKSCESLAFLIRDVAHITPHNFVQCVQTLKTFVEASFMGRNENEIQKSDPKQSPARSHSKHQHSNRNKAMRRIRSAQNIAERTSSKDRAGSRAGSDADVGDEEDLENTDVDDLSSEYHHVSLQLLDLMHTLHTRAAQIHYSWAEETQSSTENAGEVKEKPSKDLVNESQRVSDEVSGLIRSSQHSSTISINTTSRLWITAWCPLLQGMARFCCDRRSHIR
jgi:brefeldin A-resistance guanine nucleotide exchange factor 1